MSSASWPLVSKGSSGGVVTCIVSRMPMRVFSYQIVIVGFFPEIACSYVFFETLKCALAIPWSSSLR